MRHQLEGLADLAVFNDSALPEVVLDLFPLLNPKTTVTVAIAEMDLYRGLDSKEKAFWPNGFRSDPHGILCPRLG